MIIAGVPLDLKKIALHARNAEYNPKRFAAVIMRIREPRTTALIFSSGKMVCTGAKSEEASRLICIVFPSSDSLLFFLFVLTRYEWLGTKSEAVLKFKGLFMYFMVYYMPVQVKPIQTGTQTATCMFLIENYAVN